MYNGKIWLKTTQKSVKWQESWLKTTQKSVKWQESWLKTTLKIVKRQLEFNSSNSLRVKYLVLYNIFKISTPYDQNNINTKWVWENSIGELQLHRN